MNQGAVTRLVDEVSEYLGAGRVGLYEFLWILRSDRPTVPESEFRAHAKAALDRLLADGSIRLVWQLWGDVNFERDASGAVIDDHAWDDPTDKPYLAVTRIEEMVAPPAS